MSPKIKVTTEFDEEAKKVAEFTRELMFLAEEKIKELFEKANNKEWYTGPAVIIEELLYDYCLNSKTQRSWLNYCGADVIPSQEEQLSPK
jgi:hypothetical protein